jgi:hypothetical protein
VIDRYIQRRNPRPRNRAATTPSSPSNLVASPARVGRAKNKGELPRRRYQHEPSNNQDRASQLDMPPKRRSHLQANKHPRNAKPDRPAHQRRADRLGQRFTRQPKRTGEHRMASFRPPDEAPSASSRCPERRRVRFPLNFKAPESRLVRSSANGEGGNRLRTSSSERNTTPAPQQAQLYWTRGNHCRRLEGVLAARAPELEGLLGTRLADHFDERWQHCVSLRVNENVRIKHQLSGGSTAAASNARKAGCSIICGHTHSLKVFPVSNYTGTFFGVDSGMLANPQSSLFSYCEDAPCDWRSGFVLLTFCAGVLQWPEVVPVVTESPEPGAGTVWFRGELVKV